MADEPETKKIGVGGAVAVGDVLPDVLRQLDPEDEAEDVDIKSGVDNERWDGGLT